MIKNLNKQHGAAIVVALFITALVATMAVAMLEHFQIDLRQTELLLNANQANLYAQGTLAWGMDQLNNNWTLQMPGRLVDATPIHLADKQNHAVISSTIYDAQGYFNLNNLKETSYQESFLRLLKIAVPNIDEASAQTILSGILDWIKPGVKNTPFDTYYATQRPAYTASHQPMVSVSELRLIKGVTPAIFNQLTPFITALPDVTPININNASAPVLMSLSKTMTLESAKAIEAYRTKTPFFTTDQFTHFEIVKNNPIPTDKITVTSNYFLIQSNVTIGEQRILINTLVNRITEDKKSTVVVLWQTKGAL